MSSPRRVDPVAVIESVYAQGDRDVWIEQVLGQLSPLLDFGGGLGFALIYEGAQGRRLEAMAASDSIAGPYQRLQAAAITLPAEVFRLIYKPLKAIVRADALTSLVGEHRDLLRDAMTAVRSDDALWVSGFPAAGFAFQFAAPLSRTTQISRRTRDLIQRLRIHIDAALRLRLQGAAVRSHAILLPTGRVVHRSACIEDTSAEALSTHARSVEAVRTRRGRADEDALHAWSALVRGTWSLVERIDSDGRRHYVAFENPPHARVHRALSPMEVRILEMSARGLSGKHVAYELGSSASVVSECVTSIMIKLGITKRTDLLRFARQVACAHEEEVALSDAERAILRMLDQGLTNAQIAASRNTSVNTVANQVAKILRKSGAGNRHHAAASIQRDREA